MSKPKRKRQLKRCPFCGAKPEFYTVMGARSAGCSNQECGIWNVIFSPIEWNTRAKPKRKPTRSSP